MNLYATGLDKSGISSLQKKVCATLKHLLPHKDLSFLRLDYLFLHFQKSADDTHDVSHLVSVLFLVKLITEQVVLLLENSHAGEAVQRFFKVCLRKSWKGVDWRDRVFCCINLQRSDFG